MFSKPLLSDVELERYQYKAGDRVLIKTSGQLDAAKTISITNAAKKMAKADIRVWVIDASRFRVLWYRSKLKQTQTLVSIEDIEIQSADKKLLTVSCSVVEVEANDKLTVIFDRPDLSDIQKRGFTAWIKEWVGPDVEIELINDLKMA